MRPVRMPALVVLILTAGLHAAVNAPSQPAGAGSAVTQPAATRPARCSSALHLARSADGLVFKDTGEVLLDDASAPDLARLPNGHLLLLCDREAGGGGRVLMVASQSADDGRHWSPPQLVRMEGAGVRPLPGRHGALVWMPNGLLRLYFVAGGSGGHREGAGRQSTTQPSDAAMILSAVTRDGLHYKSDRVMGLAFNANLDLHVTALQTPERTHLFVDESVAQGGARSHRPQAAVHLISRDGQHFEQAGTVQSRDARFVGGVVAVDGRLRAYLSAPDGIRSMVSADGVQWKAEDGVRLAGGSDPAVAQLKDGTYLMVYCTQADERSGGLAAVASQPSDGHGMGAMGESPGGETAGAVSFEPFASESTGELPGALPILEPPSAGSGRTTSDGPAQAPAADEQATDDSSPPKPDFRTRVDYAGWLNQQYPSDIENNASDAYDALHLPDEINDMFNSEYNGPIIPWDPAQHPEWEATHNSMQGLLDQFRQAARYERYACPLTQPGAESSPDGGSPLMSILLPSLAVHRALNKATMADAWRAEGGQVDPARMVDAFETCLRSANHMEQAHTLIHHLVGMAEQALVERNALKALEQNVFKSPEQMESALNVLRERDQYDTRRSDWITLEHAAVMDGLQYVFMPAEPGGPVRADPERVKTVLRPLNGSALNGSDPSQEDLDAAARLTPEDVRKAVDAYDAYYRELAEKWRIGYPQVRSEDIKALNEKYLQGNDITRAFAPNLQGAYRSAARNEATRRATQLTYEVHLFKARNGRWPSSLDEVAARPGSNSHTDPFTGGGFGYRLTENGPVIYTAGEDGQDNGGEAAGNMNTDGKDYVFWPPQK